MTRSTTSPASATAVSWLIREARRDCMSAARYALRTLWRWLRQWDQRARRRSSAAPAISTGPRKLVTTQVEPEPEPEPVLPRSGTGSGSAHFVRWARARVDTFLRGPVISNPTQAAVVRLVPARCIAQLAVLEVASFA
jgi:hypothetical protein